LGRFFFIEEETLIFGRKELSLFIGIKMFQCRLLLGVQKGEMMSSLIAKGGSEGIKRVE